MNSQNYDKYNLIKMKTCRNNDHYWYLEHRQGRALSKQLPNYFISMTVVGLLMMNVYYKIRWFCATLRASLGIVVKRKIPPLSEIKPWSSQMQPITLLTELAHSLTPIKMLQFHIHYQIYIFQNDLTFGLCKCN